MTRFYHRAIKDILENRFLTGVTVITIALSIMIASAFALFFINAGEVLNIWKKGVRLMVYLKPDTSESGRLDTKFRLQSISGVKEARYISKEDALERLKEQMKHHAALLDNLKTNPLPDAYEVLLQPETRNSTELEFMAERIAGLPAVAEVEYGRRWIQRFTNIINLFSLAGYAIGMMFFMAAVFIVANTIRLMLYSRRDEIHIMRLVGATDRFIKIPFYLEGMIQGGVGSLIGLTVLLAGYYTLAVHFQQTGGISLVSLRFFSPLVCLGIVLGGVLVGWVGCLISLKQFMKD